MTMLYLKLFSRMWVGREQFLNFEVYKELVETVTPAA